MDLIEEKTFNKHKLKLWMKSKAKRMIRKQIKYTTNKDFATAAMMMRPGEDDEGYDDSEEREERIQRNRAWRERRERERRIARGEVTEKEMSGDKEDDLTSQISQIEEWSQFLSCSDCGRDLVGRVWQCQLGHPVCRNCVDELLVGEIESESSSNTVSRRNSSSSSTFTLDSSVDSKVKTFIDNMDEQQLMDFIESSTATCSEDGSQISFSGVPFSERNIKEIDWFLNTLNIRKDAILPYNDYHATEEETIEEEPDCDDAVSDTTAICEAAAEAAANSKMIPKDELALREASILRKKQLDKKFKKNIIVPSVASDPPLPSQNYKRTSVESIDFFAGTLQVKKDVIQPYQDYHFKEAVVRGVHINEAGVEIFQSDDEDDDDESGIESASVVGSSQGGRRRTCNQCDSPFLGRNLYLEGIISTLKFGTN